MGKPRQPQAKDASSLHHAFSALAIQKPSRDTRHRRHHSVPHTKTLIASILADVTPGEQMEVDLIDVPLLLRLREMLSTGGSVTLSKTNSALLLQPFLALMKSAGLSVEVHHRYLMRWQSCTASLLSSPVLVQADAGYWSHDLLQASVHFPALHFAILAVAGMQAMRTASLSPLFNNSTDQAALQRIYKLRADAERRLLHRTPTENHQTELCLATILVLLLFDYLTGNVEEWTARILSAKLWLREASWTADHPRGRSFFWTVARHDRVAASMRTHPNVLDVEDLRWPSTVTAPETLMGLDAKMSVLLADLMRIGSDMAALSALSPDEAWDAVDAALADWRASFPLSLMTFQEQKEVKVDNTFPPGLLCATGGDSAILLHSLYAETMIRRLSISQVPGQLAKIHEHAMTLCRLASPLLDDSETSIATLDALAGGLFMAGGCLRSHAGRVWVARALEQIGDRVGNLMMAKMTACLQLIWREERTRPRVTGLLMAEETNTLAGGRTEAMLVQQMVGLSYE